MMAISLAAPVAARGWRDVPRLPRDPTTPLIGLGRDAARADGRVIVVALDGATLDIISPAVAEGRLPNFGRIFDGGAVLHLATLRPTQAETVWTAAVTGRRRRPTAFVPRRCIACATAVRRSNCCPTTASAQALVRFGLLHEDAARRRVAAWRGRSGAS